MPAITLPDLNNAKLDVDHIADIATSTALTATDRLGQIKRTLKGQMAAVDAELASKLDNAQSQINVKVNEAAGHASDSASSAAEALGYLQTIRATSYGAYDSDPATDPLGNPPTEGDEYFNTTAKLLKRWNGTTWQASDINTANLAASSGSSLIGHDGETVQDVLDGAKSLQDYAALRAYTGRAKRIYITGLLVTAKPDGIAGVFQYDPTDMTSADNGGTIIVGADGRRWKRDFTGAIDVKWTGAVCDGVADDTIYINAVVDSAPAGSSIIVYDHKVIGPSYVDKKLTFIAGNGKAVFTNTQWNQPCFIVNAASDVRFSGTFRFQYIGARPYPIPVPTSSDSRIQDFYNIYAGSERILSAGIVVRGPSHNFKTDDIETYGGFCGVTITGNTTNTLIDSKNVSMGVVSVDSNDWGVLIGGGIDDISIKGISARNIKVTSPSDPSHAIYVGPRAAGVYYNKVHIGFIHLDGVELLAPDANNGDAFSIRSCKDAYIGSLSVLNSYFIGNTRDSANLTIGKAYADLIENQAGTLLIGALSAQTNSSITILDGYVTARNNTTNATDNVVVQSSSGGKIFLRSGEYKMVSANPGQFVYFGGSVLEVDPGVSIKYTNPVSGSILADRRLPIYVYSIDEMVLVNNPYLSGESKLISFSGGISAAAVEKSLVTIDPNKIINGITDTTVYDATTKYKITWLGFARTPSMITAGAISAVLQGRNTLKTQNTVATALAAFPRGSEGQKYIIHAGDALTSITHGNFAGGFVSKTGANIAAGSWKAVECIWITDRLHEVNRV